ncbi:hypothetical protein B0H13DRAFT_1612003 [Mycena leptocephala]|nr:hypothetical protein B0H13DRAFT_1612003 [Mycena leptocephala]
MENKGVVIVSGIKTGLDAVGGMEAIEKNLSSFAEGMPVLMQALDEIAKIHPFIQIAVTAFQAVWALEQKRRDNDRKVLALHLEIKQMMSVLRQLQNVRDAEANGSTIEDRMGKIVRGAADDIKDCANACDTYSKKKLVVKVLKGPIWDVRLLKFVEIFAKRRSDFEFALSIHTSLAVDAMNAKMDLMLKLFQRLITPEQKEMARYSKQLEQGGKACLDDDEKLKQLNDWENNLGGSLGKGTKTIKRSDLDDLKEDLRTDPDESIQQNMTKFARKFDVQMRQIVDEMSHVMKHQGDRIISAVTAGPHDKIIDRDVHSIWKDMGWRGSVKTRRFVMALRDYFQENHNHESANGEPGSHVKADDWALQYIDVVRVQPVSEAIDDDASGFATVGEVNRFTSMRPKDWSLPHWIAYWAIGHHQAMTIYVQKINELMAKMFAILPRIRRTNKSLANGYLTRVHSRVYVLTEAVNPCYVDDASRFPDSGKDRFTAYIKTEEVRIRGYLEAVHYDIDASNTIELVTGKGRIDRYVLLLIYLLLERHFEIFRIFQKRKGHPKELSGAADTLECVFHAVSQQFDQLRSIFKLQKLDLKQQFKSFAFGLVREYPLTFCKYRNIEQYQYMNEPDLLATDIDATKILNYPLDQKRLDFDAYAPLKAEVQRNVDAPNVLPAVAGMLGVWHGFIYWPSWPWPSEGMSSLVLTPSSTQGEVQYFTAADRATGTDFKIDGEGRVGDEPGTVSISFKRSFPRHSSPQYYTGTWTAATETLTGTIGFSQDPATHMGLFVFKRIAPEYTCFTPRPVELQSNKPRALWIFAIAAVRFDVRRNRWSWSYFKERRDARRRFIELYIRSSFGPPMTSSEREEWGRLLKTLTTADRRFYHSLGERKIRATTDHNVDCSNCKGNIGGARLSCLVCQMKDRFKTVDFCSTPSCVSNRVMWEDMEKPHLPHHDLVKLRRVVHTCQFGKTFREAREALKNARAFFMSSSDGMERNLESTALVPHMQDVSSGPLCIVCKKPVSQPCWYCVQCGDQSFICWKCDAKDDLKFGKHAKDDLKLRKHDPHSHDLVRVQELVEDKKLSIEERLVGLEERFSKHEKNMEDRLGRIEALLEQHLNKSGSA